MTLAIVPTELAPGLTPARLLRCLGDETRLQIMLLIQQHGELCVCELTAALALSQPKVSRHLAQLRQCGLLADRRQGQWVFYQLPAVQPDWVRAVLEAIVDGQGSLIEVARQRLAAMNNRPDRCC